jgi:hypothetical protein
VIFIFHSSNGLPFQITSIFKNICQNNRDGSGLFDRCFELFHKFTPELRNLMKRFLIFIFFIFIGIYSFGQKFHVVVFPVDVTVCDGGKVTFTTIPIDSLSSGAYNYKWLFKGAEIPDSIRKVLVVENISPADTGYYKCVITDTTDSRIDTSSPSHIMMRAQLHIDTLYRYNALGCPYDSNGQMKIRISGGHPPYTYNWGGGSYHQLDTLGVGFPKGTYTVTVTDSDTTHCVSREFTIKTLVLHKITFTLKPGDTVFMSNPFITATIPDTALKHLDNWKWDFGDGTSKVENLNPCEHEYTKIGPYNIILDFTDNVGGQLCDSTIDTSIIVKTLRLFVPNAITPGSGDDNGSLNIRQLDPSTNKPYGTNLDLSDIYLSTQMYIYNRQGRMVFEKTNYKSGDWDGGNLSAGVYYYLLKCHGEFGDEVYRGAVTIIRR